MEPDDIRHALTEKGILTAMEMHQKTLDGWSLEQIATYYDVGVLMVRILLAMFYKAAEETGTDLGIYVPDTLEGLDTDS